MKRPITACLRSRAADRAARTNSVASLIRFKRAILRSCLMLMAVTFAGCSTLGPHQANSLVPTRHELDVGPYRIATNALLADDAPVVEELLDMQHQVERTLGMRIDAGQNPIEVYILDDRPAFNHFLKFYYPELPPRRAFFFAQGPRRVVYAYKQDRLAEDLRHEASHALLHASLADLPLWLDEGLAEYFECPGKARGLNREHLEHVSEDLQSGWKPDLARLEQLVDVRQMTPTDYREAWSWVHFLLTTTPENKAIFTSYLDELAAAPHPQPLSSRLAARSTVEDQRVALLAHLQAAQREMMAMSHHKNAAKVRSQSVSLAPTRAGEARPTPAVPDVAGNPARRLINLMTRPLAGLKQWLPGQ